MKSGTHFFAYMFRMRNIRRWGLMRNAIPENVQEHSWQVAIVAHALAVMHNETGDARADEGAVALYALYHEAPEVITGDFATPIKYFTPEIRRAIGVIEDMAADKMLAMLPSDLRPSYAPLIKPDESTVEWRLVKAADRICALIKCVEERKAGNAEFERARMTILRDVQKIDLPAVKQFMEKCLPSFELTLDELN